MAAAERSGNALTLKAWWDPGWYNLDQPLKVGQRDTYAFFLGEGMAVEGFDPHPERLYRTKPGYDLVFANTVGSAWDYRSAIVESIEHDAFGPLDAVETLDFGQYTFRFHDGRWVTIEAEQGPGSVNAASSGFPSDACDPAWANTSGWALTVVLADVTKARSQRGVEG
jgi:hypothetical protein